MRRGPRYRRTHLNTASLSRCHVYLGGQTVAVCLRGFSVGPLPHHSQSSNPALPFYPRRRPAPSGTSFVCWSRTGECDRNTKASPVTHQTYLNFLLASRNSCVASCFICDAIPFSLLRQQQQQKEKKKEGHSREGTHS